MAFSGKITAANHADLLAKVTNFITGDPGTPGRDWTVARQDSLAWGPATVFRNTGLSGSEEVYVGLCAATYTDGVKGGLVCKVYKAFDSAPGGTGFLDTAYGNGTGQNGTHAFLPCWNAAMNVWIWSNKARVVIVAECNGVYANAYLGQLRRFSLPSENPWPLACLTDGYTRPSRARARAMRICTGGIWHSYGGALSPWQRPFLIITPVTRFAGRTAYGPRTSPFAPRPACWARRAAMRRT